VSFCWSELSAVALGALGHAGSLRACESGLALQASGAAAVCLAGFSCARDGLHDRCGGSRGAFAPQFRRRRVEWALSWCARAGGSGGTRLLARLSGAGWARPDGRCADRRAGFVVLAGGVLCARPVDVFWPAGELMTLVSGPCDPGRPERRPRPRGEVVFVYLAVTPSGWSRNVDRDLAARTGRRGGRRGRDQFWLRACRRRSRWPAIVGMGTKAGVMPLHVWFAAGRIRFAPRAGLGADERRDDQGRDLRARASACRLARLCCRSGSGCSCSLWGHSRRSAGVLYALFPARPETACWRSIRSENIGIIVLGIGACLLLHSRGANLWASFALAAALLHTLNHAVFKALLFLGAGGVREGLSARSSSIGSAASCGGCPGPAAPSL